MDIGSRDDNRVGFVKISRICKTQFLEWLYLTEYTALEIPNNPDGDLSQFVYEKIRCACILLSYIPVHLRVVLHNFAHTMFSCIILSYLFPMSYSLSNVILMRIVIFVIYYNLRIQTLDEMRKRVCQVLLWWTKYTVSSFLVSDVYPQIWFHGIRYTRRLLLYVVPVCQ